MSNEVKNVSDYLGKKRPASYETLLNEIQKAQTEALWELSSDIVKKTAHPNCW